MVLPLLRGRRAPHLARGCSGRQHVDAACETRETLCWRAKGKTKVEKRKNAALSWHGPEKEM